MYLRVGGADTLRKVVDKCGCKIILFPNDATCSTGPGAGGGGVSAGPCPGAKAGSRCVSNSRCVSCSR